MRITPDTNVLVRAAVGDDMAQSAAAIAMLREADLVAVPTTTLCEFVWVLTRGYKRPVEQIAAAILQLANSSSAVVDRPNIEAGLAMLRRGGDFADGVIAFEGRRLGGQTFASFDQEAIRLVKEQGGDAHILSPNRTRK